MNLRLQHIYTFHISKLFGTDLHLFELGVWLHSFGLALISVFIPIILFQLGLTLPEIIAFYALFYILNVPINFIARKVIEQRGARFAVIFSSFALVLYFFILFNLHNNWLMIILLAVSVATYDAFYWVGHLYIFTKSIHHTGKLRGDVGMLKAVRILGCLVAPIVGAYILIYAQQKTLIFVAALLVMGSLIPLFRMRHLVFKPEEPTLGFMEFFKGPREKINYAFTALAALRTEVSDVIWPFFIFFIYGSLKTVAYIPMLIALSGLFLTLIAGKFSLKRNIYKMIAWGGLMVAIVWVMRLALYTNETFAILSVLLIALLGIFVDVPSEVAIFTRANETNPLAAMTYLNAVRMFARGTLYLILLVVVSLSANFFIASFYIIVALMLLQFILGLKVAKHHIPQ